MNLHDNRWFVPQDLPLQRDVCCTHWVCSPSRRYSMQSKVKMLEKEKCWKSILEYVVSLLQHIFQHTFWGHSMCKKHKNWPKISKNGVFVPVPPPIQRPGLKFRFLCYHETVTKSTYTKIWCAKKSKHISDNRWIECWWTKSCTTSTILKPKIMGYWQLANTAGICSSVSSS